MCISGLISENGTIDQGFIYTGLTPYTQYYIYVMAKSSGATGPAAVVNITTKAEGKHTNTHVFSCFMETFHRNNDFILCKLYILFPYTYPTHHRKCLVYIYGIT